MVTCAHNSVVDSRLEAFYVITLLRLCEELGRNGRGRLGWRQGLRVDRRRLKEFRERRPVVLEGMTVAPRAETSGQAKWLTWTIRATGMKAPVDASADLPTSKPAVGRSSVDATGRAAA
jgi:hypothetical protein